MWRDTLHRTAWLTTGSASGRLLPYLVMIGLGRILGPADFAGVALGFAWSGVAASLSIAGLSTLATQRLSLLTTVTVRKAFIANIAALGLGTTGFLCIAILFIGLETFASFFRNVVPSTLLLPALVNGVIWSLSLLSVSILNGLHLARSAAGTLSAGGLCQGLGMIAGYTFSDTAAGVLWGLSAGSGVGLASAIICIHFALRSHGSTLQQSVVDPYKNIWSALFWNTLAAASVTPVTLLASSFLTHQVDGARQLAAFLALEQLHQLAIFVPGILGQALLPTLTVHLNKDRSLGTQRMVIAALLLALFGMSIGLLMGWNATWLHRLVGNTSLQDTAATRWMLIHAGLALSLTVVGSALLAQNLNALACCLNLAWAAVFLLGAWAWAVYGASGVQLARLIASILLILVSAGLLWRHSRTATTII